MTTVTKKKRRPNSRTASRELVSTSCLVRRLPATSMMPPLFASMSAILDPAALEEEDGRLAVAPGPGGSEVDGLCSVSRGPEAADVIVNDDEVVDDVDEVIGDVGIVAVVGC